MLPLRPLPGSETPREERGRGGADVRCAAAVECARAAPSERAPRMHESEATRGTGGGVSTRAGK